MAEVEIHHIRMHRTRGSLQYLTEESQSQNTTDFIAERQQAHMIKKKIRKERREVREERRDEKAQKRREKRKRGGEKRKREEG